MRSKEVAGEEVASSGAAGQERKAGLQK